MTDAIDARARACVGPARTAAGLAVIGFANSGEPVLVVAAGPMVTSGSGLPGVGIRRMQCLIGGVRLQGFAIVKCVPDSVIVCGLAAIGAAGVAAASAAVQVRSRGGAVDKTCNATRIHAAAIDGAGLEQ
jgi:hypothetical protein